ncbi:hypothetical conserved protein [Rhizobium etli CIAT 652]|uniref:Hypothetical conserved protein n=2 Tax=Rhizobium TaxID=379 RepID=B3PXH1_RHIE6|nr:hypothetical conserved protein [Rhizobium etli CIAT 652]
MALASFPNEFSLCRQRMTGDRHRFSKDQAQIGMMERSQPSFRALRSVRGTTKTRVTAMAPAFSSQHDDVDVLAGAIYTWCAERNIKLRSQQGLSIANIAIDLYHAGHQTQDDLLTALHEREFH